jgi:hypothetical protein
MAGVDPAARESPARERWRALRGVGISMAVVLAAATASGLASGNSEFIFYIAVLIVLMGAIALVHFRVGLPPALLWALAAWGVLHLAGGLVPVPASWPIAGEVRVLYSWWIVPGAIKYDVAVHAYGFGTTTWLCWEALSRTLAIARPSSGILVLCAAGGMGFGALNEVIEFAATKLLPHTNVGGYENTGYDLIANLVGSPGGAMAIAGGAGRRGAAP